MTHEEAIEELQAIKSVYENKELGELRLMRSEVRALDMAIQALSQEPCDDAISRQAVLEGLKGCICEEWVKTLFATMVKQLPSVTQKSVIDDISIDLINEAKEHMREGAYNDGVRFGLMLAEQIVCRHRGKEQKSDKYRKEAKRWKNKWLKSQKSGKWRRVSIEKYIQHAMAYYECSECGGQSIGEPKYCPNCGAKMESEDYGMESEE